MGSRGCVDQIFALRKIIEQCLEWNAPLHVNFIDFKKAFDSLHREAFGRFLDSMESPKRLTL